jgi:hypothetical protein
MPIHETQVEFDSIESAHDFVDVLAATVLDAVVDLNRDRKIALADGDKRRVDAIDLALFKLKTLTRHLHQSRRNLNDLRSIRRLLLEERKPQLVLTNTA